MTKVAVTGAAGNIGTRLVADLKRDHEVVAIDLRNAEHIVDCSKDLPGLQKLFKGCDTVVHLAGNGDNEGPWEDMLNGHIGGTYNAFEAARLAGVRRVIYPSSNHAVGEYEVDAPKPQIYEPGYGVVLDNRVPVRPDSPYGAAKVFGEALGRFYSDRFGLQVACLRIGSITHNDKPVDPQAGGTWGYLKLAPELKPKRLLSTWCSHRDFHRLVRAIMARNVAFGVVYVVGDNPTRQWDLEAGRALYGWWPIDGSAG